MQRTIAQTVRLVAVVEILVWPVMRAVGDDTHPSASKPVHAIKIEFDRRVPMRDGVTLSADDYRPDADGRFPVILTCTPYLKTPHDKESLERLRYFAARGYAFVVTDVRGRGDSGSSFAPYRDEGRDGYDAIEWCAGQPWSSGKVGTLGGSYTGKNQ